MRSLIPGQRGGFRYFENPERHGEGWRAPWGHITSGGTVANFEAMWIARTLKFFPFAVRAVAKRFELKDFRINLPDGTRKDTMSATAWGLFNMEPPEILNLRARLMEACYAKETGGSVPEPESDRWADFMEFSYRIDELLTRNSVACLGLSGMQARIEGEFPDEDIKQCTMVLTRNHHYCWQKIADALGLGSSQLMLVDVDENFRMDMELFERALNRCLEDRIPIVAVVCVCGSTEESSIDPLHEVVRLREEFARRGLTFYFHSDAASILWDGEGNRMSLHEIAYKWGFGARPAFAVRP